MASVTHQLGISADAYTELVNHHLDSFYIIDNHQKISAGPDSDFIKVKLERKTDHKKLIIFDLDETLAHCTNSTKEAMGITDPSDVALQIPVKGKMQTAHVNIRKSAWKVLEESAKYFEVMVFTASVKDYADAILNYIDPSNDFIHHWFYWESCVRTEADGNQIYVKDLRMFEDQFELKDIVIVDNAVYSFINQLENGIPIIPFWYDWEDD